MTTTSTSRREWGLRYGDGEVEWPLSYAAARSLRKDHRDAIRSGEVVAADYEPMTVVARTVTTTPWKKAGR